jgi:hypothetical protein
VSLLSDAYEKAVIYDKVTTSDGRGGVVTTYNEGAEIDVAFSFDTSTAARIAEQEGASNRYTLTTRKSVNLQFHDVIKRLRDGKIFRVTSDGDDNYTPASASLDMRQVEAEEWRIPANG